MAGTIIKLRRTTTANAPTNLNTGELAYAYNVGGNIRSTNSGNRLYIGDPSSPSNNPIVVGGAYYVNLLQHTPGTLVTDTLATLNIDGGAIVTDQGGYIDKLLVGDNTNKGIQILGGTTNTISTTRSNADLQIDPNGTGDLVLIGGANQFFLINDGNIGTDTFSVASATGNTLISGTLGVSGITSITSSAASTSTSTGALVVTGGVGIGGNLYVGGNLSFSGTLTLSDDLAINGGDLTTTSPTFNLINSNATTVNFAGAATTLEIGAATGTTNINNNLDVDGDLNVDGGDITTTATTFFLLNTTVQTANLLGAATTINIGAATGNTNVNNNLVVTGDAAVNGGDLTTTSSTFNLVNANATTVNFAGAANTLNVGSSSTVVNFGKLGIVGNTIYNTDSNSTSIVLDPYPSAGDSGGSLIVRGNLTVTGTTTTVNSTSISVNEPIIVLGDSVSTKTVVAAASSGQAVVQLDNVTDLIVGTSVQSGNGVQSNTTVSKIIVEFNLSTVNNFSAGTDVYDGSVSPRQKIGAVISGGVDSGNNRIKVEITNSYKVREYAYYAGVVVYNAATAGNSATVQNPSVNYSEITLSSNLTTSIPASTNTTVQELTFTQATDDAFDRGIQFNYVSSNLSKTGFFGFRKNTGDFAFIPDATFNNNVASGTLGTFSVGTLQLTNDLEVQYGGTGVSTFTSKGILYGNGANAIQVTAAANMASPGTGSDVTDSYQILTVNSSGTPVWTTTIDGGTY